MEYREAIGDRLYGCDECLDVCPWNKWAQPTQEMKFAARSFPSLGEMLEWDEETFTEKMQGSPMRRLKWHRFRRNLCIVLGNVGESHDLAILEHAITDADPVVAEHAQWAKDRIKKRHVLP